jgi:hypothetical protein
MKDSADPLSPSRGCFYALVLAIPFWTFVIWYFGFS